MQNNPEHFAPLVTQLQPNPSGDNWPAASADTASAQELPRGLGLLVRAGARLRRTLWISGALGVIALVEFAALLAYPEPTPLVVWELRVTKPLVEVP